jgi:peptidoglycan/LPS O-acetylase OafA/YrhL
LKRDDIQGLRAIAVLTVLLFHAFPNLFPGGYIGVDVFFVISGYLITGLIYREISENRFTFSNFYSRRVRRIFPALFVVLVFTVTFGCFLLSPEQLSSLSKSAISAIFSVSNIYFWKTSGYFATEAEFEPLLHTWSLGVEEQFYILLPIAVIAMLRLVPRFALLVLIVAFFSSLALSEWALIRFATASYFMLPTRAFELLAGSILAVSGFRLREDRIWLRNGACTIGIGMILIPTFTFSGNTPFPGLNALYPTVGSALIILAGVGNTIVGASRFISMAVFRYVGDISYSLYLWHWPILALMRIYYGQSLPMLLGLAAIIASILSAALSYRFVEQPFMHRRSSDFPFLRVGGMAMAVGTAALIPFIYTGGFPGRFPEVTVALFAAGEDYNPKRAECHNDEGPPMPYSENCIFGTSDNTRLLAVWGDSHGAELAYALGSRAEDLRMNILEITSSACPPALNYRPVNRPYCVKHNASTIKSLIKDTRVSVVVLTTNGIGYRTDQPGLFQGIENAVRTLTKSGKKVILVEQQIIFDSSPPTALGYASLRGLDLSTFGLSEADYDKRASNWNQYLERLGHKYGADIVSVTDVLCWNGFCPMRNDAGVLYFNRNHVSLKGADLLARKVIEKISAHSSGSEPDG